MLEKRVLPLDIDEKQLLVFEIIIDAVRKQSDMKEVIDQLPKELRPDAKRFLEFIEVTERKT